MKIDVSVSPVDRHLTVDVDDEAPSWRMDEWLRLLRAKLSALDPGRYRAAIARSDDGEMVDEFPFMVSRIDGQWVPLSRQDSNLQRPR